MLDVLLGYTCAALTYLISIISIENPVVSYICVGLAILQVFITLASSIHKWFKDSTRDGKITIDEFKTLINDINSDLSKVIPSLEIKPKEEPKKEEPKKEEHQEEIKQIEINTEE